MTKKPALQELIQQLNQYGQNNLPPVAQWDPPYSGEIDIRIASDGSWHHEGKPIERDSLVKLFASILKHEADDEYYLVSPVEKFRIQVDDAPFLATEVETQYCEAELLLIFTTNLGDRIVADETHPIEVDERNGEPRPYLSVRDNLLALISRNLFYQLVELAETHQEKGKQVLRLRSGGCWFRLGSC